MISGFGRTGRWFGCEHWGVVPDVVTMGKGLGTGFPVSGLASTETITAATPWGAPSGSSSSYGGNPMAGAAILASVTVIEEEGLVRTPSGSARSCSRRFREMQERYPFIGDVRGKGLLIGVELVKRPRHQGAARQGRLRAPVPGRPAARAHLDGVQPLVPREPAAHASTRAPRKRARDPRRGLRASWPRPEAGSDAAGRAARRGQHRAARPRAAVDGRPGARARGRDRGGRRPLARRTATAAAAAFPGRAPLRERRGAARPRDARLLRHLHAAVHATARWSRRRPRAASTSCARSRSRRASPTRRRSRAAVRARGHRVRPVPPVPLLAAVAGGGPAAPAHRPRPPRRVRGPPHRGQPRQRATGRPAWRTDPRARRRRASCSTTAPTSSTSCARCSASRRRCRPRCARSATPTYGVEDSAFVVLDFGDRLAEVRLTWAARRRAIRFRFVGERGELVGDDERVVVRAAATEEVSFDDGMSRNSSHSEWYAPLFARLRRPRAPARHRPAAARRGALRHARHRARLRVLRPAPRAPARRRGRRCSGGSAERLSAVTDAVSRVVEASEDRTADEPQPPPVATALRTPWALRGRRARRSSARPARGRSTTCTGGASSELMAGRTRPGSRSPPPSTWRRCTRWPVAGSRC